MAVTTPDDFDVRLRAAAFQWLSYRSNDGTTPLRYAELANDFAFEGRRVRLIPAQQGIWKPGNLKAALSIRTVYTPAGAERPYEDTFSDDGILRYKWRGTDPKHYEVAGLRRAMDWQLPLIWFLGVADATYLPIFPIHLVSENAKDHEFVGSFEDLKDLVFTESVIEERFRRYIKVETRKRLHQPVFRADVMRAYRTSCAVCALRHGQLLDAAHIIGDREEHGVPTVQNGMAMCKIHHAAFDANILGVRPDFVVEIREDLLHEHDGPMLRHGLQQRHKQRLLTIPRRREDLPATNFLEQRYERFRAAS